MRIGHAATSALLLLAGCSSFSYTNEPLRPPEPRAGESLRIDPASPAPTRATFAVDGRRGNGRVLFFLALSGGGSRAAYLSAATMLRLQTVFDDVDLLREVDVLSSVSGGSLPAAYYAISRDESLPAAGELLAAASWTSESAPSRKLALDAKAGRLSCEAPLDDAEKLRVRSALAAAPSAAERIVELCAQSPLKDLRPWNDAVVRDGMTRNYLLRWIGNWFRPNNVALYWLTAYNRADIMAQTLQNNLYDRGLLGFSLTFADINPYRPYLIINSTNTTEPSPGGPLSDPYAFGSVFTFTDDDFRRRVHSPIAPYSIARAVAASSAFPLVFPNMTLRDFRSETLAQCAGLFSRDEACGRRYLHLFDGGNSDNLGLKSVKRALFELAVADKLGGYDHIVVLLVDAFTEPRGTSRQRADPRAFYDRFIDTNVVDAIDALLKTNRARIVGEFAGGVLRWSEGDCRPGDQNLPPELCTKLRGHALTRSGLDLGRQLFFYHFGFDDVAPLDPALKARLDRIPTSFHIDDADVRAIDEAVNLVMTRDNPCLQQIRAMARGEAVSAEAARHACEPVDRQPKDPEPVR